MVVRLRVLQVGRPHPSVPNCLHCFPQGVIRVKCGVSVQRRMEWECGVSMRWEMEWRCGVSERAMGNGVEVWS